jgi:hypothetical protein
MSASGHSLPKWAVRAMSGLPPIATELRTSLEVRSVPISEVADQVTQRKSRPKAALIWLASLILILAHYAKIVFGVLEVILRHDPVPGQSFGAG